VWVKHFPSARQRGTRKPPALPWVSGSDFESTASVCPRRRRPPFLPSPSIRRRACGRRTVPYARIWRSSACCSSVAPARAVGPAERDPPLLRLPAGGNRLEDADALAQALLHVLLLCAPCFLSLFCSNRLQMRNTAGDGLSSCMNELNFMTHFNHDL
jgi:hypothetical protein